MPKKLIKSNENLKNDSLKEGFTLDTYDSLKDFIFSIYMTGEDNTAQQRGLLETLNIEIEGDIIAVDSKMRPDIKDKKGSRFDCQLKTTCGRKINIEAQKKYTKDFKNRLLTNGCKMITSSIVKGENYNKIKNVIVIAICDFNLVESPYYHNVFTLSINANHFNEELTNKLEIHILEMPKFRNTKEYKKIKNYLKTKNKKEYINVSTKHQYLIFMDSETSHEERKEIVKMGNEGLIDSMKKIEDALQDEDAFDIYISNKIDEMSQETEVEERVEEGRKEGMEKGIEKGREEGSATRAILIATNLKNNGFPIEEIAEVTDLTPEFIEKL